jgi:hypothetical protein
MVVSRTAVELPLALAALIDALCFHPVIQGWSMCDTLE